jgi:NAD(P)-dependent dehydrogenase (short-subunit alcohol dehydrogenase family)
VRGKNVVVTGATGGLGGAVVDWLIARGATVYVPMIESVPPAAWSGRPEIVSRAGVALDDEASVVAFYDALPALSASIHLVGGFAMAPITETSLADFRKMLDLNATTCFLCCREAVRAMKRGGGGGRIVNVAARPVVSPVGGMIAYAASKAAVASITQCLAAEVKGDAICVNAVLPSIIDTPANRASMPTADHAAWPKPAELAEVIGFLASPDNALTSGALVPVYGRA